MPNQIINKLISDADEIVLMVARPALWRRWWQLTLAAVLLVLPFFLIYPLFQYGVGGLVGFFILLVVALALGLRIYLSYYYTALLVTNKRLIDLQQRGFFFRDAGTVPYGQIQDVTVRSRGVVNRLLGLGDIYITFTGDRRELVKLTGIKRPDMIAAKIMEQREAYLDNKRQIAASQAVKLLRKIKNRLGEARYNELISD